MTPAIELVYDPGCPHVEPARAVLREALNAVGLSSEWRERVQGTDSREPAAFRWASPTILIDGRDIVDGRAGEAVGCRLYEGGAPSLGDLVAALEKARGRGVRDV